MNPIGTVTPFPGGLILPDHKAGTRDQPIRPLPMPRQLYLSMEQHIGAPAKPCVHVGQAVLKGDRLGIDETGRGGHVHAPTSGTITAITDHPLCHASGLSGPTVVLTPDGQDRWHERQALADSDSLSRETLLAQIRAAGIVGLGGAGFPTAVKLAGGNAIHTLILNGAECEPYITCDDRLMRERADEIVAGTRVLLRLTGAERALFGVEDNKPEAIEALWQAIRANGDSRLHVVPVPSKYPAGGERQLVYLLTGREVPSGQYPEALGIVVQNVMTAAAVHRAVHHDEPLIARIVTVTGEGVAHPGNYEVLLGTPVADLLAAAGADAGRYYKLIVGGPMMGFTLDDLATPVSKISNCLLAAGMAELPPARPEQPCIRCGACVEVCPANLLPQQLFWFTRSGELARAEQHHLFDCIECGACAYVCPSTIPLVAYYRAGKSAIRERDAAARKAARLQARYENRQARLEREQAEKADKLQQRLAQAIPTRPPAGAPQPPIAAPEAAPAAPAPVLSPDAGRKAEIAAAIARAKARKQGTTATTPPAPVPDTAPADPRKAEIAAAIARAKARKQGTTATTPPAPVPDTAPADPRKAEIAAAIARAKARRAAQNKPTPDNDTPES